MRDREGGCSEIDTPEVGRLFNVEGRLRRGSHTFLYIYRSLSTGRYWCCSVVGCGIIVAIKGPNSQRAGFGE